MRITGVSSIDFRAGFSTQPSLDLNHTIEWPLQGTVLLTLGAMLSGTWGSLGRQAMSVQLEWALCRLGGVGSLGGCWSWRLKVRFLVRRRPLGSGVACVPQHGSIWRRLGSGAGRGFWLWLPELYARNHHLVARSGVPVYSLEIVVPHHGALQRILLGPDRKGDGERPRPGQANSWSLTGDQGGSCQSLRAVECAVPLTLVILVSPSWFCARTSSKIFKVKGGHLLI